MAGSQHSTACTAFLFMLPMYVRQSQQDTAWLSLSIAQHAKRTLFMLPSSSQNTVIGPHGGHNEHLLAEVLHNHGEEGPAGGVKVVQVFQHDGQRSICPHKLPQYLTNQSINQFIHPSISQPTNQSVDRLINQSIRTWVVKRHWW